MAVYLTKSMMSRLNKVTYPSTTSIEGETSHYSDQWEKLTMDSNIGVKLSKEMICRVCARNGCTPLSSKISDCDIMGAIRSVTNITINADDSLPKYICTECLESLKIAMRFKKNCEVSDKRFRKILNPMGDPLLHSYPYSKHDFQLILHQMKLKRMETEEKAEKERRRRERLMQKKDPKTKEFKCSPCDMIFPNKEKLVAHRRERQCMRRACDICGQLVRSIAQHMRHNHEQNVVHKCPTCGKEFPIIARLKNHMLVHTNTFNFFCDLCPYKCKHKYYLVMHMRTHTGEKPYKCAQCPATFVNPSNLNKHKLTHQEKQFKCMLCEKAFRTGTALWEHHDAKHMNIKHTCTYCGRDFCYKSDLRKHEIRNHNRVKRDYIGGEPTYKQLERLQKMQEDQDALEKWRQQQIVGAQPQQPTFIDQSKDFIQTSHSMYVSDVTQIIQQPTIAQQQTVQLAMPDLTLKKDEVKMYDAQGMAYF
ncbi:zinc finger protein 273-like [Vanessa tameamea]|uniref:Zinc finger protein 273-like n=1 Tax=Vanessa tameamea TaxID=334116 RepID=A0A8B8HV15_VANTA|nr:zinc finger protein 273-like [Vanessa tameamea]